MTKVKILAMSDTHNESLKDIIGSQTADIFIHCGDWTMLGNFQELSMMRDYIKEVRGQCDHFLWIVGNHDLGFEDYPHLADEFADMTNTTYLHDRGKEVMGIKFWGSNYVPEIGNWAFMYSRPTERWKIIPDDTQILVTHGMPYKVLDGIPRGYSKTKLEHVGCRDLKHRIDQLKSLKVFLGGHLHEGRDINGGRHHESGVDFYNCSIMNEMYYPTNKPQIIEVCTENMLNG